MDIQPFALPGGLSARIHRRPTHGQLRRVEELTRRALGAEDPIGTEDALVLTLVDSWDVLDDKGAVVRLDREGLEQVPQDVLAALADELLVVAESVRPANLARDVSRRLAALGERCADPDRERLAAIARDFDSLMGLDPNA